jgi:hypothetical protein
MPRLPQVAAPLTAQAQTDMNLGRGVPLHATAIRFDNDEIPFLEVQVGVLAEEEVLASRFEASSNTSSNLRSVSSRAEEEEVVVVVEETRWQAV